MTVPAQLRDSYCCANLLIKHYGDEAELNATEMMTELAKAGDHGGVAAYVRIIEALKALRADAPPPGQPVH